MENVMAARTVAFAASESYNYIYGAHTILADPSI